jgi:hypothetical protein
MAPASHGSRDINTDFGAAAVATVGALPHAPDSSSPTPTSTPSLFWFASFTLISRDGFLIHQRGVISSDPVQIWLTSDAGEKIRSWKSNSIRKICFGARFCFDDLRIWIGPQLGSIRVRDFQPTPPFVRAYAVIRVGS